MPPIRYAAARPNETRVTLVASTRRGCRQAGQRKSCGLEDYACTCRHLPSDCQLMYRALVACESDLALRPAAMPRIARWHVTPPSSSSASGCLHQDRQRLAVKRQTRSNKRTFEQRPFRRFAVVRAQLLLFEWFSKRYDKPMRSGLLAKSSLFTQKRSAAPLTGKTR
jgi:hypothetical protein